MMKRRRNWNGQVVLAVLAIVSLVGATACDKSASTETTEESAAEDNAAEDKAAEGKDREVKAVSRALDGPALWKLEVTGPVEATIEGSTIEHNADCSWHDPDNKLGTIKYEGVMLRFNGNDKLMPVFTAWDSDFECGSGEPTEMTGRGSSVSLMVDGHMYNEGSSLETDDSIVVNLEINTESRVKGTIEGTLSQRMKVDKNLRVIRSEPELIDEPIKVTGTFDSNPNADAPGEDKAATK